MIGSATAPARWTCCGGAAHAAGCDAVVDVGATFLVEGTTPGGVGAGAVAGRAGCLAGEKLGVSVCEEVEEEVGGVGDGCHCEVGCFPW